MICNSNDYRHAAKSILHKALYEYIASGTDDEQTLSENESAFKSWYLRPRVMKPIRSISTSITLFGQHLSMPVFISPAGVQALVCSEGEVATARAARKVGTIFGLSQHATRSIEQVARQSSGIQLREKDDNANNYLWYQSYILKDRARTLRLIQRAVHSGYRGIFLTVDSVRFGYREADARNGWSALPPPHRLVNYDDDDDDSGNDESINKVSAQKNEIIPKTSNTLTDNILDKTKIYSGKEVAWDQNTEQIFEQNPSWNDVRWLKTELCSEHTIPLVVKGIMTAEDAIEAVKAGADGVMVSNHGGRALDGALPAIDALPEVVNAVGDKVPILLDGGIRRGTDVVKALALGATAVGIGRPVFYALAVGGEDAVVNLLEMMRKETEAAMAICGCKSVSDISRNVITRHPIGGSLGKYIRSNL